MKLTTLGDICDKSSGIIQTGPFGSQLHQADYVEHGIPVIMPQDIVNNTIATDKIAYISETTAKKLGRHLLKKDDIVFPRRGDINKRAIIGEREFGFFCGTGCLKISVPAIHILPLWLFYYLGQEQVIKWIEGKAVGSTMLNLNTGILRSVPVYYPEIAKQHKIANILSTYDDLITTNQRRIGILEESARRIYREWFVHLRFPGHEEVEVREGVPEGWERLPLGNLAMVTMGQSPESKYYNRDGDGLPFHQGVTNFRDRFVSHEIYTKQSTRIAEAGDILCSVRAPVGRLNITTEKIAIGRGLSAMRSHARNQSLLFYQLDALFVEENMIGGGTIFASVAKKELLSQVILQPSPSIASAFNKLVSNMDAQIEVLDLQNQKLTQARDLLLPKLMSGKLDLSSISPESP